MIERIKEYLKKIFIKKPIDYIEESENFITVYDFKTGKIIKIKI